MHTVICGCRRTKKVSTANNGAKRWRMLRSEISTSGKWCSFLESRHVFFVVLHYA